MVPTDVDATRARVIDLDPRYFAHVDDLAARFPAGAPSLADCERLHVRGDHRFGADVIVKGRVELVNDTSDPIEIESGALLRG